MKVLFIKSQKKGKIKTCLHFYFPSGLARYPLTWYNDKKISVPPWPSRLWIGGGEGRRLGKEKLLGDQHDFRDSKKAFFLPVQEIPSFTMQC